MSGAEDQPPQIAKRRLDDISTVAAAIAVDVSADGRVSRSRFALGGVAATPVLVAGASEAIAGRLWNEDAVARVQAVFKSTLAPIGDHRGSKDFRAAVSASLVEKFWWEHRA